MKTNVKKYAHELQSFIDKGYFYYGGHPNPVKVLSCSTYKTGKHGSAKTTLRMEDLITERTVSDIVASDEVFYAMEDHTNYQSWSDAQISAFYYDDQKDEFYVDVITYTETFEMTVHKKIKLVHTGAKNLQKLLDRLEIKIKPVIACDQLSYEFTGHIIRWSKENSSDLICLNVFVEKL